MASDTNRMDIAEFREFGYLQELNRRFLHPLGLALMVRRDSDGTEQISGIWDCRDDPEGIVFACPIDLGKVNRVDAEIDRRRDARMARLGYYVQPTGEDDPR